MEKFEFSVPMQYSKENINELININNKIEKSIIKSLFFSLPSTCELYTGFEQPRNRMVNYNFDFWKGLMSYSLENNFEVIYNFNLARAVEIENPNLCLQLEKLDNLLCELSEIGVRKLRISNMQLLAYISQKYHQFDLYISTVANFNNIYQFKNLKELYPNVKQVVIAQDMNKNFRLLNNIKNKLNMDLEIMCSEGCLQGCINFFNHHSMTNYEKDYLGTATCTRECQIIEEKNPFKHLCQTNHVFPWEIKEYSKIGITKFKLTGRDGIDDYTLYLYYKYLKAVDNIKNIDNFPISLFLNNSRVKNKLNILFGNDVIKLMPQIKKFKKFGHLCASQCGAECKYCYKCAEKIQKVFEKKQEELQKRNISCCIINK